MSKTRKTTPSWIRLCKDPRRLATEVHDHRFNDCDLPATPAIAWQENQTTSCQYEWSTEMLYGKDAGCPCWMCHGAHWLRADRRRDRHNAKRATRVLYKELYAKITDDEH